MENNILFLPHFSMLVLLNNDVKISINIQALCFFREDFSRSRPPAQDLKTQMVRRNKPLALLNRPRITLHIKINILYDMM